MVTQLVAFLPVVTILVLVPGANNVLVLRTAAETDAAAARAVTAGASAGIAAWSTAVALGVGGLVTAVPGGLDTLVVLGSAAMIAMGAWAIVPRRPTAPRDPSGSGFGLGLAVCLVNPRTPLTAVSLLPQYAVAGDVAVSTIALGAAWATIAGLWNLLCVAAVGARSSGPPVRQLRWAGGLVLCLLGVAGLVR